MCAQFTGMWADIPLRDRLSETNWCCLSPLLGGYDYQELPLHQPLPRYVQMLAQ
ncbi:hypothetical protein ACEQPO_14700 [Bacillus sp. SL00103]